MTKNSMETKRILIVTPSFTWHVDPRVAKALNNLIVPDGFVVDQKIIARKLIHASRNEAIKDCIVWKYDYLLFCDDDNAPKPDALKLLLEADKSIVGWIIRKRNWSNMLAIYDRTIDPNYFREYQEMKDVPETDNDVFEVWNIGTGFVLYKAELLHKVYVAYDYCPFENKLVHYVPTVTRERIELERFIWNPLIKTEKDWSLKVMRQMLSEDLLFHERCIMWWFKIHAHKLVTLEHYWQDDQIFTV